MRHRLCLVAVLGPLCIQLLLPPPVTAQDAGGPDLPKVRAKVVDLGREVLKAQAFLDVLEFEKAALDARRSGRGKETPVTAVGERYAPLLKSIEDRLTKAQEERRDALKQLADSVRQKCDAALKSWGEARAAELAGVDELVAAEAHLGLALDGRTAWPFWDQSMLWVVLWGGLLVLMGLVLATHEGRRGLRQRLRFRGQMGAAAAVVLAATTAGCGGLPFAPPAGAAGPGRLAAQRLTLEGAQKKLAGDRKRVKDRSRQLEGEVGEGRKQAELFWADLLAPEAAPGNLRATFLETEGETHKQLREILTAARTAELAAEKGLEALKTVRAEKDALENLVSRARAHSLAQTATRVGMCLGFVYLGFLPLRRVRKRLRKQRREEAEQCPRCLAVGGLQIETSEAQDDRYPEPKHVHCPECDYRFRASYRKLPRFCFPTVGVVSSGKTHWLVTAYDLIKNKNVPVPAVFEKLPSLADEEFDVLIETILKEHQGARATGQGDLPYPLTFHVEDTDRFGASAALLNLFDFSGELMDQRIDKDTLRRRALLMEGFVLFLDPTQVQGKGKNSGIDYQNRVLAQFHEEMRDMRELDVGTRLRVPVAVCISKLDLLTVSNPLGSQAEPWIRSLRSTTAEPVSLKLLRARSRMCEQVLPAMFPGWNIKKTLQEAFGDRFLFFPMTPVGLEELGVKNLANRTFAPFGVLEPILWLLHMHGYCMLE